MLHYTPQHVSSSTLLIIRRTNFIKTDFSLLHLTSSVGLTSPITEILLHYCLSQYCFNNTADLSLLIQ